MTPVQGFQPGRSSGVVDTTNPDATRLQKIEERLAILGMKDVTVPKGELTLKKAEEKVLINTPQLVIPATGIYAITLSMRLRLGGVAGLVSIQGNLGVNGVGVSTMCQFVAQTAFALNWTSSTARFGLNVGDVLTARGSIAQEIECIFDVASIMYQRIS